MDARCRQVLEDLGLDHLDVSGRRPVTLNGLERVYVALARAFVGEPYILLLDDPASALGSRTATRLMEQVFYVPRFADGIATHERCGRPLTRLIVTTELDYYLPYGDRFFIIDQLKVTEVGDRSAVISCQLDAVKDLLAFDYQVVTNLGF